MSAILSGIDLTVVRGRRQILDTATLDVRPGAMTAILGPNERAFGHVGAGGSIGMADPDAKVAIGYVMNAMGQGILLNDRGQSLIDAVYDCL